MKSILFITVFSLFCLCTIGQTQAQVKLKKPTHSNVDSILASINGTAISLSDVLYESQREESRIYLVYSGQEIYEQIKKVRKRVVEDIITRKLILNDYNTRKPFEIPRQYIENMLDEIAVSYGCSSRSELIEKAKRSGSSFEKLRSQAKDRLIIQVMVNNYYFTHVNLTPRELYEYYQKHKDEFSSPAKIKLHLLMLNKNRKDLNKVLDTLKKELAGADKKVFTSMSRLYSDGPNAARGGDLGWIDINKLRPEFAKAIKSKSGHIAGPVKTDEGIYFLRTDGYRNPKTVKFEDISPELSKK